jgi:nitroreductase/NAD-dependent dihydropyrimidine dehydrogenase PreA subunit
MSWFTVDTDKCMRDGLCVAECALGLLQRHTAEDFPSLIEGGERACMSCGHCVAVCPHDACSVGEMNADNCAEVRRELLPSPEQIEHLVRSRRATRRYQEKPVAHDVLARLLDIARHAPSAHNEQPLQWIVIEDRKEMKHLAELLIDWMRMIAHSMPEVAKSFHLEHFVDSWDHGDDRALCGAPHLIIAHADKSALMAQTDSAIAIHCVELAAYSMGLGACWNGAFHMAATTHPPTMEALQIPEGHQCLGALMIGYPKNQFRRIPLRNEPSVVWR